MAVLANTISLLLRHLVEALLILFQFLLIIFLGLLTAIFYAFPWFLRVGVVILWFYGGFRLVMAVDEVYSPFSPTIPVMILQFLVVFAQVISLATIILLTKNLSLIWGGLFFSGGITLWLAETGITKVINFWQYGDFFFRIFPPALWVTLLIIIVIRGKKYKVTKTVLSMSSLQQGGDTHEK